MHYYFNFAQQLHRDRIAQFEREASRRRQLSAPDARRARRLVPTPPRLGHRRELDAHG